MTAATVPDFHDDTRVRFVSGQSSDDASGVFDDVLDEILQDEDAEIKRAESPEKSQLNLLGRQRSLRLRPADEFALPGELPNPDAEQRATLSLAERFPQDDRQRQAPADSSNLT